MNIFLLGESNMKFNKLSDFERSVIENKATEPPYTNEYYEHFEKGIYKCKRCNAPLFASQSKFHSGSGWPSFDEAILYSVEEYPDKDGKRTEVVCANCKAHLGHIFKGEKFTDKNVRYCINSASLDFVPYEKLKKAYFAGGCFWGVEYYLQQKRGVISVENGYMGGNVPNPTYNEVCNGNTGHLETVEVLYYPEFVSYEELAKLFFEIHDPTQKNGQGPDIGTQYLSAIFYNDQNEKEIIEKLITILKNKGLNVVTLVLSAKNKPFYKAEKYHQDYYFKNHKVPYCHSYKKRF
jgi:peptide methionine sulfoxide reductase msrA/msrB